MTLNKLRNSTVLLIVKLIKAFVSRNKGFTLIETLIGFSIFTLIISLVPICIVILIQFKSLLVNDKSFIFEMMIKEIGQTVHSAEHQSISVHPNKISIPLKNETVTYSFDNFKVVKSINGKGNITIFNHVMRMKFYRNQHFVIMQIKFKEGNETRTHEVIL